jgi:hypothetical protein
MKNFYVLILFLLIIILINLLINLSPFNNYQSKKYREGFAIPGLSDMSNTIDKLVSVADDIPKEINNIKNDVSNSVNKVEQVGNTITNEIDDKLTDFLTKVENLVINKIKSFFTQFGNILNDGLVNPIIVLFEGIGYMFLAIFDILKEIANKIISLPSCILIYMFGTIIDTLYAIYAYICPNFIRKYINYMYNIIIQPPIDFILKITGFSSTINKCYSFNVNSEINKMQNQFSKINTTFKNDFGKLDFASIQL